MASRYDGSPEVKRALSVRILVAAIVSSCVAGCFPIITTYDAPEGPGKVSALQFGGGLALMTLELGPEVTFHVWSMPQRDDREVTIGATAGYKHVIRYKPGPYLAIYEGGTIEGQLRSDGESGAKIAFPGLTAAAYTLRAPPVEIDGVEVEFPTLSFTRKRTVDTWCLCQ